MMDFISIPLVVGIITLGIYKLFELFACRKERMAMIEKLADKLNAGDMNNKLSFNLNYSRSKLSFGALKSGLLMSGIGIGLLVAFFICYNVFPNYTGARNWDIERQASVVYGSSVLLFGGLGLLIAFIVEINMNKKEKK